MPSKKKIDDYTLEGECGRGGFGTVYRASDPAGDCVALKQVSLCGMNGERELKALKLYKKIAKGTDLMPIHHIGMKRKQNYFYYTMDLADNIGTDKNYIADTLSERLKRNKKLTVQETLDVVQAVLKQLEVLHKHKLVHRDIKPANIFWIDRKVKIGDIGLVSNECSMTCNAGSEGYMPPANSGIDPNTEAVDLYAVTRFIYTCLTGKRPMQRLDVPSSDALFTIGKGLIRLMNLECKKIAGMTVLDFQKILDDASESKSTEAKKNNVSAVEKSVNDGQKNDQMIKVDDANKKAIKVAAVTAGTTAAVTAGVTAAVTTAGAATATTAAGITLAGSAPAIATSAVSGLAVAGTAAGTAIAGPIVLGAAVVGAVGIGTWAIAKKIFSKDQDKDKEKKDKPS